jgi:hypothetical protein
MQNVIEKAHKGKGETFGSENRRKRSQMIYYDISLLSFLFLYVQ